MQRDLIMVVPLMSVDVVTSSPHPQYITQTEAWQTIVLLPNDFSFVQLLNKYKRLDFNL